MKYGNFVGTDFLSFTKKKARRIQSKLGKQLYAIFGKDFFEQSKIHIEEEVYPHLVIRFFFKTPFSGRNWYNGRIKRCSQILFFIDKQIGYLEKGLGEKDYKNCPPFSYGCSMRAEGMEIPYRCKNPVSIHHWSPYVYGSEIDDLTYEFEDLIGLFRATTDGRIH